MLQPTKQQEQAIEKFSTGSTLKITAFAGTGKTSTLVLMAQSAPQRRGLYLAFGNDTRKDARAKFPDTVACRTTHSLAYQAISNRFRKLRKSRHAGGKSDALERKLTGSLYARQLAGKEQYEPLYFNWKLQLAPVQQAHLILETIRRFRQSVDPEIAAHHVPKYGQLVGASSPLIAEVTAWAVAAAAQVWTRMQDPDDSLPLGHDGYLKLWTLSKPTFEADYVLLDEAQDTNAAVLGALQCRDLPFQIVYVGDPHQQIYEWRGAVNAMEQVKGCLRTSLTQSFRFGETIAVAASQVLAALGETQQLRGNPRIRSRVVPQSSPAPVVLARTNSIVISETLDVIRNGGKPCIVGGTEDLKRLIRDVYQLKQHKLAASNEFFGFTEWSEVVAFAESDEGESIRMFVQLVQRHGEEVLWNAVNSVQKNEAGADVILSTAHKAKGREWDSVRLASDFASSSARTEGRGHDSLARLFYVAITRARKTLAVDPSLLTRFAKHRPTHKDARPVSSDQAAGSEEPQLQLELPAHADSSHTAVLLPSPHRTHTPSYSVPSVTAVSEKPKQSFWRRMFGRLLRFPW